MICPKCGHANSEGSFFCSACGVKLAVLEKKEMLPVENRIADDQTLPPQKTVVRQKPEPPRRKEKKAVSGGILLISVLIFLLVIGGSFFGYRYFHFLKMEQQADLYKSMGEYEKAIEIYNQLIDKTHKVVYVEQKKQAEELIASRDAFEEGMEAAEQEDITLALKLLSKVPEQDEERYEEASKKMQVLGKQYLADVNQEMQNGNFDYALGMIEEYQKILPDSKTAKDLKVKIIQKKTEYENQQLAQAEARKAESDKKVRLTETKIDAQNIIGTYQTVVTAEANIRSAPRIGDNIIAKLYQGAELYILDTKVESASRIWCKVRFYDSWYGDYYEGWVSYNTMNYSL